MQITWGPEQVQQLPIRSLVGLIPLYATLTLEPSTIKKFPGFKKRMEWFIENRSSISKRNIANMSRALLAAMKHWPYETDEIILASRR